MKDIDDEVLFKLVKYHLNKSYHDRKDAVVHKGTGLTQPAQWYRDFAQAVIDVALKDLALDTDRLDWLIEQGCSHGVVYEGLDKSFWMVWLDGHDAHKDKHQIGRHHTAREAIDAAIAAAEAAHKQHAQPQADALDAELLDWLEGEVCHSYTGVTITRIDHREEGMVIERGFRLRRFHKDYEVKPTLRAAIAAAKESK